MPEQVEDARRRARGVRVVQIYQRRIGRDRRKHDEEEGTEHERREEQQIHQPARIGQFAAERGALLLRRGGVFEHDLARRFLRVRLAHLPAQRLPLRPVLPFETHHARDEQGDDAHARQQNFGIGGDRQGEQQPRNEDVARALCGLFLRKPAVKEAVHEVEGADDEEGEHGQVQPQPAHGERQSPAREQAGGQECPALLFAVAAREQLARQQPDHPDRRRHKENRNDAQPERAPPEDEGRQRIGQHGKGAVVGIRVEHAPLRKPARAELDDVFDLHERVHLVFGEVGIRRIARRIIVLRVDEIRQPVIPALRAERRTESIPLIRRVCVEKGVHGIVIHIGGDHAAVRIHEHDFVDEHVAGRGDLHQPARARQRGIVRLVAHLHPVVVGADRVRARRIDVGKGLGAETVRRTPRRIARARRRCRAHGDGVRRTDLRIRRARVDVHLVQRGAVLVIEVEHDGAVRLQKAGAAAPVEPADGARAHYKERKHEDKRRLGELRPPREEIFYLSAFVSAAVCLGIL